MPSESEATSSANRTGAASSRLRHERSVQAAQSGRAEDEVNHPMTPATATSYVATEAPRTDAVRGPRRSIMAKASKATTPTTMDFEIAEDRSCELDDFTVNFVTIRQDHDLAPMLAGLPGGMCQCPHWGVMTKGRMTVTLRRSRGGRSKPATRSTCRPGTRRPPRPAPSSSSSARPTCSPRPKRPSPRRCSNTSHN